jgi:PAS domain S-box-containing protein
MRRNRSERLIESLSRKRFQSLFDVMPDPIVIVDSKGRFLAVNRKAQRATGYKRKELLGKNFLKTKVATPKSKTILKKNLAQRMKRKRMAPYEIEVLTKDGTSLVCEVKAAKIEYEGKQADLAVFHGIAERKMIESRLSALNLHARKLNAARSLQQVYELTLDAMQHTLGFEHAAFLIAERGKLVVARQRGSPSLLLTELPLDSVKQGSIEKEAKKHVPLLVPHKRRNKDYVKQVRTTRSQFAVPVETENKVLGVLNVRNRKRRAFDEKDFTLLQILASHAATAISNLKKREELEKRSNQFASLMKSSTKMIGSTDLRERLQTIAEAIIEFGWRRAVISVRDEDMEIRKPENMVTAGLTEDERQFLWNNKPPGQVWQERFGSDYERFRVGEFYYLPWSDPWVRKKFSDGTVPSKLPPEEMVDWDPQDLLYAPLHLADERIVGVLSIDDPVDGRRPTKESLAPLELFIHQAAVAVENAQLIHSLNVAREQLTADAEYLESKVEARTMELRKSQEQLLKAQRLAAIGELASMVGHDLRNPLTGIAGATYYLKSRLGSKVDKKAREMLDLIERDIEYSNKIVNDLLEYSKELRLDLAGTSPKLIMKEALSLVRIPQNIRVVNSTQSRPRINVDAQKITRVFVNIIKNAIDAMPRGGKLTISSKKANGHLEIAFADTGMGMSENVLRKLWTPLFTTKAKGMGLGLPICRRIVKAHRGSISVKTELHKGTVFTVNIPVKPELEGGEKVWLNVPESSLLTTMRA